MITSLLAGSKQQMVLIVDDQDRNLNLVSTVLAMTGFGVMTAKSGEEALLALSKQVPDLILLDVLMPNVDGIEVCRQIRENVDWRLIPIIFLSAADDKNLIVQALECGGVDYVTKPFNKAELLTRVRTHLALKEARDQLKMLAEDKDELLGILAHDMQNHLAGMRMSAELLQNRAEEIPARLSVFVENIAQSTDSLLSFVKDFLANQSAERLAVRNNVMDLRDAISELARRLGPLAQAKKIELVVPLPPHPIWCYGDEEALARVLDNLGSNALKFSPLESQVRFTAESLVGAYVAIQIEDQGPGFTEKDLATVFRRYARLSARPTAGESSTGLGLSIVKKLVEAMRGSVSVQNRESGGACMTVKLPKAQEGGP